MSEWLPGTWAPKGDPVVNLFTNPSFEKDAGTVEVRRNKITNPAFRNDLSGWDTRTGGGAVVSLERVAGTTPYAKVTLTTTGTWWRLRSMSMPVVARQSYAAVFELRGRVGDFNPIILWHNSSGSTISESSLTMTTSGDWQWFSYEATAPDGAVSARVEISRNQTDVGNWFHVRRAAFSSPGGYFDGSMSPDIDLTASWVGGPDASESILTGVAIAGVTTSQCVAIRSTRWSKTGRHSMRLIPTGDTASYARLAIPEGGIRKRGSIIATTYREAPLTGPLHLISGRVSAASPQQVGTQTPNAAGEFESRLTFSELTSNYIAMFGHGGTAGSGDVWWDLAGLYEGDYTGPVFTGDNTDSDEEVFAWAGERNNSPSTRQQMEAVMATIYGDLFDFGMQSLAPFRPILRFTPSGPGLKGSKLFAARPVEVEVSPSGAFAVLLEPTYGVVPEAWYTVSIEYLNPGGRYTSYDILGYRLRVPAPGGTIGDLPDIPLSPDTVLVSLDPPPPGYTGWYLNAPGPGRPTGDPDDPASSGTGILEIVS